LAAAALLGSGHVLAPWREARREAWDEITAAAEAGDYGAVWDRFDPASQQRMAQRLREFAEQEAPDRAAGMTDRERYALLLDRRPDSRAQFLPGRVARVTRSGEHAVVELDREDPLRPGHRQRVDLARHGGRWLLSFGADPPR
jgi:hypothetical protein